MTYIAFFREEVVVCFELVFFHLCLARSSRSSLVRGWSSAVVPSFPSRSLLASRGGRAASRWAFRRARLSTLRRGYWLLCFVCSSFFPIRTYLDIDVCVLTRVWSYFLECSSFWKQSLNAALCSASFWSPTFLVCLFVCLYSSFIIFLFLCRLQQQLVGIVFWFGVILILELITATVVGNYTLMTLPLFFSIFWLSA